MVTSPRPQIIDSASDVILSPWQAKPSGSPMRHIILIDLDDLRATAAKEGYTFNEEIATQFVN